MMAATILVVGFVGMIQAVTIGSEMLATARRQTVAAQIMTHELEALRLVDWATITGYSASSTAVTVDPQFTNAVAATGATYTLSRSCAYVSGTSNKIREITFTVTWTVRPSGISASRTYTRIMSGYYSQYGLNLTYQRS